MNDNLSSALQGWLPYKLFLEESRPFCQWLFTGEENFTDPFFADTIAKCMQDSRNSRLLKVVSSLDILPLWSADMESIAPSAIIFHVSRCGSTLVSQLLALQPSNIVLSEVPFFDELLRQGKAWREEDCLSWLNSAIAFHAVKKEPRRYLFIKTDSWHIFFYAQLRKLYPQTPFVLLYRRPDEVIRSQQKKRGMQAVPGLIDPQLLGFNKKEVYNMTLDEYMAAVLEKYFEAFLHLLETDRLAFPVNYREGAVTIVQKIAGIADVCLNEDDISDIRKRATYHAKYPGQQFSEESIEMEIPSYCEKAFGKYERLEKIRSVRWNKK